jgi:hypothetical protein
MTADVNVFLQPLRLSYKKKRDFLQWTLMSDAPSLISEATGDEKERGRGRGREGECTDSNIAIAYKKVRL